MGPRPAICATCIIGGVSICTDQDGAPLCALACTAGATLPGKAVEAGLIDGAAPAQVDGTDNAPIEAAWPIPADMADPPPPRPVKLIDPSVPVLEASPLLTIDRTAPAPVAATPEAVAFAAVLVPPIMNIRMSMLIGIVAMRAGMVSALSDDIDDIPDSGEVDDEDDPDAGEARVCSACGVAEISCPADMTVSACVPAEVPAA